MTIKPGVQANPVCPVCLSGPFAVELDVTDWAKAQDAQSLTLTLDVDGMVTATGPEGQDAPDMGHDGSDAFVSAWCVTCGIALVNEVGETRLRRATVRQCALAGQYPQWDAPELAQGSLPDSAVESLFTLVQTIIDAKPVARVTA